MTDPNEYKIFQAGKAQGKSDQFIKTAILAYRANTAQQSAKSANSPMGILGNAARALPGAAADVVAKPAAQFLSSAAQAPATIATGGEFTGADVNVPGLGNIQTFQKQASQRVEHGQSVPMSIAQGTFDTVTSAPILPAIGKAAAKSPELIKAAEQAVQDVAPIVKTAARAALDKGTQIAQKRAEKYSLKLVTPEYESLAKGKRGNLIEQTAKGKPRVEEGFIRGRKVNNTQAEIDAAKALKDVPGFKPSGTALQNFNTARAYITSRSKAFETALQAEKTAVPKKEIASAVRGAIEEASNTSLILQSSDPAAKQYVRVLSNAVRGAEGNPNGIWQVRKTLDAAYENARGSLAYDSDKVAALDEIHRASRNALNNLIEKYAKNTSVKDEFKTLKNLYNAKDELLVKAQSEGTNSIARFTKKHPGVSKSLKSGAAAIGAGTVYEAAKHTAMPFLPGV